MAKNESYKKSELCKIRVLHIIAAPTSGGAETFVRDLSCSQATLGVHPHLCFINRAEDLGSDLTYEADFLSRLEENNIGYSFLGHEVRRRPWLGALRLRSLVRKKKIDVIHSHLAYGNVFAVAVPNIPLVYTHHTEKKRFSTPYWLYFRARVSCFVGISKRCVENLQAICGKNARVKLVRNGVDLSTIVPRRQRATCAKESLRAISIGRITPQKNYPLLAKAVAGLDPTERALITVDVFGEGDPEIVEHCLKLTKKYNESDQVLFFRGISTQIRDILSSYDLFLMSSDWEGMPIALLEAAAAGLPMVVTDVGGCREAVETGPSGLVVAPGDVVAYRASLRRMLAEPLLRELFAKNALRTARIFSIEKTAEAYVQIYTVTSRKL